MRDVVSASYNHTPKSGTLPKTEYKSYKDFLENYSDNKNTKDDVESVSSNDSGVSSYKLLESKSNNTSTSSLNSDVNGSTTVFSKVESTPTVIMGGNRTGSFRNYLDNYNNKKFNSVKPTIASKPNVTTTTIKSEIVIQITDPLDFEKKVHTSPRTRLPPKQHERSPISPPLPPKQERPPLHSPPGIPVSPRPTNIPPPPPLCNIPTPPPLCNIPPPPPLCNIPPPPPLSNIPPPPPLCNIPPPPPPPGLLACSSPKKWATVETENCHTTNEPPKIPKSNVAAANLAKILNEHVLARRKVSDSESPCLGEVVAQRKTESESPSMLNGETKASTLPRQAPTKQPLLPKLPPTLPKVQHSPKAKTNGISCNVDSVDYCTTTVVPVSDGSTSVNKGDSTVKKLVYNTYRGLLGAYNNKANDMISTLPRNMVREDKGVAKQVESMSLQCRLDKLNGRINPKLEQE